MAAIFFFQSCIQIAPTWKWLYSRFIFSSEFFSIQIPIFCAVLRSCCLLFDFQCRWLDLDFARRDFLNGENGIRHSGEWCCTFKRTLEMNKEKKWRKNVKKREKRTEQQKLHVFCFAQMVAKHARPDEENRQNYDEKWFFVFDKFPPYTGFERALTVTTTPRRCHRKG